MSKRLLRLYLLVLLALLGLVGAAGAVSADSGALPPAWGRASQVPGSATLNRGGVAIVNSVSCARVGNCAAAGFYTGTHGHTQAFVADETDGSWGDATQVPGTATLNRGGRAAVRSISCTTIGNCTAGGYYTDSSGGHQAFVVEEADGSWNDAIEVPGTGILNGKGDAAVNSVSCAAPSKCTVGGYYTDGMGVRQAFVSAEWHGTWRTEYKALQGTPILNEGGHAQVESVSCGKPAFCTASGYYTDRSGHHQAFVARQVGAHWGNAIEAPGTAALNSGKRDGATIWSISCATAGRCTAGGRYTDHHSHAQAFLVELVDGSWSDAIKVPGTGTLNKGGGAGVRSASCATASSCTIGGYYSDKSSKRQAFVAEKTNGNWGTAVKVPGAATLNKGGNAEVTSVSCATAGYCTAGGFYTNASHKREAFVANETAGIWHSAIKVRGTATSAEVESVSCATKGHCTAGGYYTDSHRHRQAIVARSALTTSLNPGGTSCSGPFGGTGDHVVVPAGASCTLVPGTNVTHYVTVSKGGTLYATGVKIGGVLTVSGSATVCQSRVLSDVKAVKPGGSLQLGGSDCGTGNTFSRNVVVSHASHNLWIWQNTITGNLTVSYAHGKTNSIQSNSVHNLLIAHSGPVLVVGNHGKGNVSCTANKPQHGHGNKAKGKNTCPK